MNRLKHCLNNTSIKTKIHEQLNSICSRDFNFFNKKFPIHFTKGEIKQTKGIFQHQKILNQHKNEKESSKFTNNTSTKISSFYLTLHRITKVCFIFFLFFYWNILLKYILKYMESCHRLWLASWMWDDGRWKNAYEKYFCFYFCFDVALYKWML